MTYARCCFPIPNDPILANLSSGRGVVIHREACGNLASFRKQPEKWISVTWQPATDRLFHVEIKVEVTNRMGVLAQVASAIAGTQTNIDRVSVVERDSDTLDADLRTARARPPAARARDPRRARHARSAEGDRGRSREGVPQAVPRTVRRGVARVRRPAQWLAAWLAAFAAAAPAGADDADAAALRTSQAAIGRQLGRPRVHRPGRRPLRLADLRGRPLVVSLVYTNCYDVCSGLTLHLREVVKVARARRSAHAASPC